MDQYQMSSGHNKGRKGLRILWIPGRKRHHHKSRFDSTNKQVDYSGKQKKSEPWSMGGSKAQEIFFKPENSTNISTSLLPATCAISSVGESSKNSEMKLDEEEPNKFSILETQDGHVESTTPKELEANEHCHIDKRENAETLPINEKKITSQSNTKDDINSIERADKNLNKNSNWDLTDGSFNNVNKGENGKRKNKKKKKKNKKLNSENDEDEDEKTVKCLYYTLMCCECTIS